MKTSSSQPKARRAEAAAVAAVDVLLLYEDSVTGLRAKRSLDLLPSQFKPEAGITTRLWRCDLLTPGLLREQAAREAARADVIVLSVHGQTELPEPVRQWLSLWLNYKEDRPYALGLLLDPDLAQQGADHPVAAYVRKAADAAGAEFFCGFSDLPPPALAPVAIPTAEPIGPSSDQPR